MDMSVVPRELIPLSVSRYLWPTERRVITVRKHPAVFRGYALLLTATVAIFILDAAGVVKRNWFLLALLFFFSSVCPATSIAESASTWKLIYA